jgi:hypothetical protein
MNSQDDHFPRLQASVARFYFKIDSRGGLVVFWDILERESEIFGNHRCPVWRRRSSSRSIASFSSSK